MKNIFGLIIAALGFIETLLALAILPFCNGAEELMHCRTSSFIDAALGIAVIVVGVTMWRKKEAGALLSYATAVLGLAIALIPNLIVGVCENAQMLCHGAVSPSLAAAGVLITLAGFASDTLPAQKTEFEEKWSWL